MPEQRRRTPGRVPSRLHATEKRDRIVAAARHLIYERGIAGARLADIADTAGVPLGNLYYYFQTKADLTAAALESHRHDQRLRFEQWEQEAEDARARLKRYVAAQAHKASHIVGRGCEHGQLSVDLMRSEPTLALRSGELLADHLVWLTDQFAAAGRTNGRSLAVHVVARVQGAHLLGATTRNPDVITDEMRRLERWIDETVDT